RHVPAGGDPPVGEDRPQPGDGAAPYLDRERGVDRAGQQRHQPCPPPGAPLGSASVARVTPVPTGANPAMICLARARSAGLSTSTQSTVPIAAPRTLPPRSAYSWKPSS